MSSNSSPPVTLPENRDSHARPPQHSRQGRWIDLQHAQPWQTPPKCHCTMPGGGVRGVQGKDLSSARLGGPKLGSNAACGEDLGEVEERGELGGGLWGTGQGALGWKHAAAGGL